MGRDLVASGFVTRVTRRIPLVDQKLPTVPDQMRSFFRIPVAQYINCCVVFVDPHWSFCPISFGHFIVCYSSIDLCLLVTSSDVSHYTCSVIHNTLILTYPFCKCGE